MQIERDICISFVTPCIDGVARVRCTTTYSYHLYKELDYNCRHLIICSGIIKWHIYIALGSLCQSRTNRTKIFEFARREEKWMTRMQATCTTARRPYHCWIFRTRFVKKRPLRLSSFAYARTKFTFFYICLLLSGLVSSCYLKPATINSLSFISIGTFVWV